MPDEKTTLRELIDRVAAFEAKRDWAQFHAPKNLAMGLAIEAAELMEHFLWLSEQESRDVTDDSEQMQLIRDELADVFCYVLNLAHTMKIDLSEAFYEKAKRNAEKYPADLYRGKYKL